MGKFGEQAIEVVSMIISVAILAVIVGKNSQTSSVIESAGSALSSILNSAMKPVES
ncbi:hypothetical protein GC1_00017 [Gluconobacter phage GC1]|uniref:Uncharacterized protein n=1 Tax=Gluconobacter phage GC1 TaxID=2047788 RepID=A0A2I5AR78_9VIRU|nr:membrane DNA delivery [Gluconobacter phage GC1]ATS92585.1 hypothetical protein GC1_00017 [Gluconobacter phage GC1]